MPDEYQLLANAIVERAALDYQDMLCGVTIPNESAEQTRSFFFSEYFRILTKVNAGSLVKGLEEDCESVGYDYKKLQDLRSSRRNAIEQSA